MTILKCKMCGGTLEINPGETVARCKYCGTNQTVPNLDNDKKIQLFERANRLRAACMFDRALAAYESIISSFPEEAEAYWGELLCKYGMEDNKFELIDEEMKKVSGGFRPGDLTEEEQKRYDELNRRAYELYHGLPETQAEFDIAFKEMEEYHVELTSRVWERRHSSNQ